MEWRGKDLWGVLFLSLSKAPVTEVELPSSTISQLKLLLVLERAKREMTSGLGVNGKRKCYISEGEDNRCPIKMHLTYNAPNFCLCEGKL